MTNMQQHSAAYINRINASFLNYQLEYHHGFMCLLLNETITNNSVSGLVNQKALQYFLTLFPNRFQNNYSERDLNIGKILLNIFQKVVWNIFQNFCPEINSKPSKTVPNRFLKEVLKEFQKFNEIVQN
jgi:hypothetical protein